MSWEHLRPPDGEFHRVLRKRVVRTELAENPQPARCVARIWRIVDVVFALGVIPLEYTKFNRERRNLMRKNTQRVAPVLSGHETYVSDDALLAFPKRLQQLREVARHPKRRVVVDSAFLEVVKHGPAVSPEALNLTALARARKTT